MKRIYHLLSILLITFSSVQSGYATHAAGMDLTYQCIGTNQYLFVATFYRDCIGIQAPSFLPIDVSSISCSYNQTFTATLVYSTQGSDTIAHVAGLCPDLNSQCTNGTYQGYEQYIYTAIVTLPSECTDWIIGTHESARNDAITNLASPGSYDLYEECRIDNTGGICNNSPIFSTIPLAYSCTNQLFVYNHGAFDPDGDSLTYTLVNPLDSLNAPIPYSSGTLSPTYPVYTTTGDFGFDPETGQMVCTPNSNQIVVISVRIDEYRDGEWIGSVQRDLQVVIRPCNNNVPEIPLGIENLVGGTLIDSNTVVVCPGALVEFDLVGTDVDTANELTMNTNLSITIPGSDFSTSGINPITGHFTWQTAASDSGFYVFTVTIADDGCPIAGQQIYSYTILVSKPPVYAGPDTAICASDPVIELNAIGQDPFLWNNSIYLDDPQSSNPIATLPGVGVYEFVVTGDAGGLCARNDTIVVTVDPEVFASASIEPDTICSGEEVLLTATATGGSATNAYQWTSLPSGYNSTTATSTDNPLVSTQYIITITSGACLSKDTISVFARVLPSSDFQANPDTLCEGQVSSIVYVGLPGTDYIYNWSFDNGNILNGTGIGPYNVSWDTSGTKLVLLEVTDEFGCSSTDTINVLVNANPFASFDANAAGCEPLAVTFNNTSTGGSTYVWDFGDGGTSTEVSPEHVYGAGVFDVTLTITSPEGCVSSLFLPSYIEVLPVPIAGASVVEDITHPYDVSEATFHFINSSQFATTYTWDFGDGSTSTEVNPTHTYTYPDTFYVILTASNPYCDDTIKIGPIIVLFYDEIFFPSAFSPNGDQVNDDFHELQQVGIASLYFAVYNRWGELVYETDDIGGRWNGTHKGEPAEVGVYVWLAKATMLNGTAVDRKGSITLVR